MADKKNVEAILPLSPAQHALLVARAAVEDDPGLQQVRAELHGPLDLARLEAAWNEVIALHPGLRTTCNPRKEGAPLLVVWRSASATIDRLDPETTGSTETLEATLRRRRAVPFALDIRPPMQLDVATHTPDHHTLVWTCHHLFLDGWSSGLVLRDLMHAYDGTLQGSAPDALRAYKGQHALRTAPPDLATVSFWRTHLADWSPPPSIVFGTPEGTGHDEIAVHLSDAACRAIDDLTERTSVTASTICQAAWSRVWATAMDRDDVVIGTVLAGRSASIDGILEVAGYLSNAVPVRFRAPTGPLDAWLQHHRDVAFERLQHEHTSLRAIQDAAGLDPHQSLFDSLLIVQNLPPTDHTGELRMTGVRSDVSSTLPFTLALIPGDLWHATARFDRRRFDRASADAMIRAFEQAVQQLAADRLGTLDVPHGHAAVVDFSARPTRPTELRLAAVWARVLGLPEIGIDDDFFASGGSSLIAIDLFVAIEEVFGQRLPLSSLLTAPTVRQMADLLGAEAAPWRSLVPLRTGGPRRPLICIHAGGGHVLFYRELARHLGEDQPVYGMEPIGLDGKDAPLRTVEAMAAHYLTELRTVQPTGPYRLLGYCAGCTIGLEMTRQLEAAGEVVELLVFVDSAPEKTVLRNQREVAQDVLRRRGAIGLLKAVGRRVKRALEPAPPTALTTHAEVERACRTAIRAYELHPTSADALLIRSTEFTASAWQSRALEWRNYTREMEVETVDCLHAEILLEPAAQEVARHVGARLRRIT